MGRGFNRSNATIAAATATNLAAIMAAEGYTGSMLGAFLEIDGTALGDLTMADNATDVVANGRPVGVFSRQAIENRAVDPSLIWLYSLTGGDFAVTFDPL